MSANRLKVVQIVASIGEEASGPSYSVPRLASVLKECGNEVEIFSLGERTIEDLGGVRHEQFGETFGNLGPLKKLGISHSLKSALVERCADTDIFHVNGLWRMPNVYPSRAAVNGGPVVVLSPRGMLSQAALSYSKVAKKAFWFFVQSKAMQSISMFHATSEKEFQDIRAFGLKQPVVVVPNGIDPVPDESPIKNDLKKILFLGRIHPIKQVDQLLKAWAAIEPDFPAWHIEICGPGDASYVRDLKKLAGSLHISRCNFGGAIFGADKEAAFRNASLYVLPSKSENYGMTVAESLVAGTPVITTKGTPWSGLQENDCGWWIEFGVESLVEAMQEACSLSEEQLIDKGKNGHDWMRRDFSWAAIGRDMAAAYRWIRHGGKRPECVRV